jgi:hypothetical protein
MNLPRIVVVAALGASASLASHALAAPSAAARVTVHGPYVRLLPPGQPNTAAFMTLRNGDEKDHKLVKAESSAARVVELHEHVHEGGMMKMRPVKAIEIKAGGAAVLEPGGLHVMLIDLVRPLREGEGVSLSLTYEDGSSAKIEAPVRRP